MQICQIFVLAGAVVLVSCGARTVVAAQETTAPTRELSDDDLQALFERGREELRRFALFNNCEPMRFWLDSPDSTGSDIENIEDRIQTMAESRLRAARLFAFEVTPTTSSMVVFVASFPISRDPGDTQIGVVAFVVVSYRKLVEDAWGNTRPAETWSGPSYFLQDGTEKAITSRIAQSVSELIDSFILEYLRVNESAC